MSRTDPSSARSWILAAVALVLGLGLYVYDDWCETIGATTLGTLADGVEILIMGPGVAVLAFLVSEHLRLKERRFRDRIEQERERRFRFLGRIAASMAHEVRNPLHNLHLLGDELRPHVTDEARALLGRIDANLERLDQATTLIYELARPPRSGEREEVGTLDPEPILAEVVAELGRQHDGAARIDVTPPLRTVAVAVRRESLRIILHNLVRNAVEAADGAPVGIAYAIAGSQVDILIRNPGTLPPAVLTEDEDTLSAKPDGLGIGIGIARQLAGAHGGAVELTAGAGSVLARVRLPGAA